MQYFCSSISPCYFLHCLPQFFLTLSLRVYIPIKSIHVDRTTTMRLNNINVSHSLFCTIWLCGLQPKCAQTKFSWTKFARPHLPQPKFAQTQICPKPNLPRPKFAQAKFAQTHICPSQICPEPSLPQKKYMCQKINKIVKFLWTETQKFQIFTTFLP